MAAKVIAGANSGHPDPNGLHQELRLVLSSTPVVSAAHLVAKWPKPLPPPRRARRRLNAGVAGFDFDHGWALVDSPESMTGGAQPC